MFKILVFLALASPGLAAAPNHSARSYHRGACGGMVAATLKRFPTYRATISGSVVDSSSGLVLPFASVSIAAARTGGLTDPDGRFQVMAPPGNFTVKVACLGYISQSIADVHFARDSTTTLKVRLCPIEARVRS